MAKQNTTYIKGICFICKQPITDLPEAYAHYLCALAYSDYKLLKAKEGKDGD